MKLQQSLCKKLSETLPVGNGLKQGDAV